MNLNDKITDIRNKIKYKISGEEKNWSYEQYLYYRMQYLGKEARHSIMSVDELWDIEKKFNDDAYRHIFNSKKVFHEHFSKYMHRDILFLEDSSFEEYETFMQGHDKVLAKPDNMYAGIGVYIIDNKDKKTVKEEWEALKAKGYLIEEYLTQDNEYAEVYSGSLNTMRICTLINKDGLPLVFAASNQFGSGGSVTDNDDDKGIWANIDVSTGVVDSVEVDCDTYVVYDAHPDTHRPIKGFCNPGFTEVVELAKKLALEIPQCRLVGWDIARLSDGNLEVIEGNVTPELDLFQAMTGHGFRKLFYDNL